MSTVEMDTAVYYSELRDGQELLECDSCPQVVRPENLKETRNWIAGQWVIKLECAECAKEDA